MKWGSISFSAVWGAVMVAVATAATRSFPPFPPPNHWNRTIPEFVNSSPRMELVSPVGRKRLLLLLCVLLYRCRREVYSVFFSSREGNQEQEQQRSPSTFEVSYQPRTDLGGYTPAGYGGYGYTGGYATDGYSATTAAYQQSVGSSSAASFPAVSSIRQHTYSVYPPTPQSPPHHASAYVSIRQHTSAYVSVTAAADAAATDAAADAAAAAKIDLYIRTRRRFNTSDPYDYACDIACIEHECHYEAFHIISIFNGTLFTMLHGGLKVRVQHLTPFQGSHRVYGKFRCCCGKRWESAGTWKDTWQKCNACESKVYPHEQHLLERSEEADRREGRSPHDMSRCQRCLDIGRLCMPHMYYAV